MLKELITFLFEVDYFYFDNIWEILEEPNAHRQSLIKDFQIFEILTDILFLSDAYLKHPHANEFWLH